MFYGVGNWLFFVVGYRLGVLEVLCWCGLFLSWKILEVSENSEVSHFINIRIILRALNNNYFWFMNFFANWVFILKLEFFRFCDFSLEGDIKINNAVFDNIRDRGWIGCNTFNIRSIKINSNFFNYRSKRRFKHRNNLLRRILLIRYHNILSSPCLSTTLNQSQWSPISNPNRRNPSKSSFLFCH